MLLFLYPFAGNSNSKCYLSADAGDLIFYRGTFSFFSGNNKKNMGMTIKQ